jgi:hypothetical protein
MFIQETTACVNILPGRRTCSPAHRAKKVSKMVCSTAEALYMDGGTAGKEPARGCPGDVGERAIRDLL